MLHIVDNYYQVSKGAGRERVGRSGAKREVGRKRGVLLLRLLSFARAGGGGQLRLCGHCSGQAANVVLEEAVLGLEAVVVGLDLVDAFSERLQRRLYGFCALLQSLSSLRGQPLDVCRIASRAHGTGVVRGELLLLDLDLRVVAGHEYGGARLATCQARTVCSGLALFGF